MAFFEIRQYTVLPGRMDAWLELMHKEIMPFQVQQGMVICASFRGEDDDSVYFWIRRFESEEQREALYEAVYQSDTWKNDLTPKVSACLDREKMIISRVTATQMSALQ